ncbi:MAG: MFS transporter [Anaerolineales bacterium]|nr:MFS transporter [Anaerolineales bacterium]
MNYKTQASEQSHPAQQSLDDARLQTSKWWVLTAVGVGTFMSALDGSVVNTIIPLITQSLNSSIAAVEWVVTIYLLILSGLLLSLGRLGDLQGHKRVYVAGFVVFMVSSMLCGLANRVKILVLFRAIQAVGAAMLSSNSPAILTKSFPANQRGQALGLQATMTYLGLTVGPSLGGWLADHFSWRAVFYINAPVSVLAIWLSLRYIAADHPAKREEGFDYFGAGIFMAGLVSLLFGLNQGHALGWLSPWILLSLAAAVVLLITFVLIERKIAAPMLDLSLFRRWTFSGSVLSAIFNYICVYTITFLMPFYLLQGRHFSPTQTGMLLTSMPIAMAIVAPISGAISDRIGTRWPTVIGMLILSIGLVLLSRLSAQSSLSQISIRLAIAGLGTGIFISPNTSALMGAAPRTRQGIAAGILATSRNVGMVLGVGLSGAILTTVLGQHSSSNASNLFLALQISFFTAAAIALAGLLLSWNKT